MASPAFGAPSMFESPHPDRQDRQDRKVRQFSLSLPFVAGFEGRQPAWGPVGLFTFKRCVDTSTPVLCDDLQWRPAGELQVGQGIIGFDAEPSDTMFRYIRQGTVLHNKVEKAPTLGVELEDGTVLYATPDHGWLVKLSETNNRLYWRETKDLVATVQGGAVHLLRPFGAPWKKEDTFENGFLSAAYDGEGCLDDTDGLMFTQVGNAMLRQVEGFLDQRHIPFTKRPKSKVEGRQQVYTLLTTGRRNVYSLLGSLQSPRLIEVFRDHLKAKGGGALRTSPEDAVRVVRVFDAGERDIAVLSTSTETHFTGGFASHNTYARPTCGCEDTSACGHPTEEFWETCKRVVEGVYNVQKAHCRRLSLPWNEPKAQQSAQEMFQRMWDFKWTPPGRGLWMMGTPFMLQKGGACINNCAFVSSEHIDEDFAGPFTFLMDMSMLGVGVGGDTRGVGKVKIQTPKVGEGVVVEDSREGWVAMVRSVLNSFVGRGTFPSVIDFTKVRPQGRRIHGFGGTASGPGPLAKLVKNIAKTLTPEGTTVTFEAGHHPETGEITHLHTFFIGEGKPYKITSGGITDVFNMVGACVVAGGVRRSAEIMFGQPDDQEFRTLKDPSTLIPLDRQLGELKLSLSLTVDPLEVSRMQLEVADLEKEIDAHPLRSHRWASNNSIFGEVGMSYAGVAESIAANGEPGVLWLKNCQDYGRMKDPPNYKDRRAQGANPCVEQTLESFELCTLVETYPAHHTDFEDFQRTLKFAYLYAKTVTLIPTHDPRTNAVMNRNRRIGCSMSGIRQAIGKFGRREFLNWCDKGYKYIQDQDRIYSEWLGIPLSIKTTSVKPSGTVSLLCGATPGVHPPHSPFYIRNIRVSDHSPLAQAARNAGYKVEKDAYADATQVISFPVKTDCPKGKKDVSIWEQAALAADMQRYWADNQVSVTVTFSKAEAAEIGTVLEVFEDRLKSVSFLPLGPDHGYVQAPYIEITEAEYNAMAARLSPMIMDAAKIEAEDKFCDGAACEIDFSKPQGG